MEQKPKVRMCKTWEMNQATRRKKAIPQPIAETALERLRQEMAMSPTARSAQEGLKVFLNEADCPDEQISLPAGNERAPKSQAISTAQKVTQQRYARWLFHYRQEQDMPPATARFRVPAKSPKKAKRK